MHRRRTQPQPGPPSPPSEPSESSFQCNVCFDVPHEPVVTPCGHLYCWSCLFRWMRLHADSPKCPVCKSGVDKSSVIPIYGRGRSECDDPRDRVPSDEEVPPRPSGHRAQPAQPPLINPFGGVHHPAFGRFNGHRGNYENLGHSTFGLFPSWFGFQIGYYHMNEPPREEVQANQDDGFPELVSKVFILLALFIAFIITTF